MTYDTLEAALARIADLEAVASDLRKEIAQYGKDTAKLERLLREGKAELATANSIRCDLADEVHCLWNASLWQHVRHWWRVRGW